MDLNDLLEIFLNDSRKKALRLINLFIWISLFFVTFEKWIYPLSIISILDVDKIIYYLFSASYIALIQWSILIICIYFAIKYLLSIIPISKYSYNLYLKLKPEYLKISLQDVLIYKKRRAKKSYQNEVLKYKKEIDYNKNSELIENSKILMGILLKVNFIGIVKIQYSELKWVFILSLAISTLLIMGIEILVIRSQGQNRLFKEISKILE